MHSALWVKDWGGKLSMVFDSFLCFSTTGFGIVFHGLLTDYLWRIYGASMAHRRGSCFFGFFCLFFLAFGIHGIALPQGLCACFFCFGREGVGLKRAMCFWTKNEANSELDRVVFY